jgi:hypothetical protein
MKTVLRGSELQQRHLVTPPAGFPLHVDKCLLAAPLRFRKLRLQLSDLVDLLLQLALLAVNVLQPLL